MQSTNLSTNGTEFKLPSGSKYSGKYHVHPTEGAMEGAEHTRRAHRKLTPLNIQVAKKVVEIQNYLLSKEREEAQTPALREGNVQRSRRSSRRRRRIENRRSSQSTSRSSRSGGYSSGY